MKPQRLTIIIKDKKFPLQLSHFVKTIKCSDVREIFGLDFSELPQGSKVIMRKVNGRKREEVTEIEVLFCEPARFYSQLFKVANCNVPGKDGTRQTKRPRLLFLSVPVAPSFARIFAAEKIISGTRNLTEAQRVRERQDMCRPIVDAIFKFMQGIRDAGNEYGVLPQRAADYLLDDREGFSAFLTCGLIEISNNAIERCFRHLALGRRNWLQCGSHKAAEHTAFMYSLVESCRMNSIDFGDYIEYVLREIQNGNTNYRELLPNHVSLPVKESKTAAA